MRYQAIVCLMALTLLLSCSDGGGDRNGDGKLDRGEIDYSGFVPMTPGQWQTRLIVTEIDVPTLGKSSKADIMNTISKNASGNRCLSPTEAARPGPEFFGGNRASNCFYKDFDASGQKIKIELSCATKSMGSAEIELEGLMGSAAFEYESEIDVRLPMIGTVEMKGRLVGRRTGDCPTA